MSGRYPSTVDVTIDRLTDLYRTELSQLRDAGATEVRVDLTIGTHYVIFALLRSYAVYIVNGPGGLIKPWTDPPAEGALTWDCSVYDTDDGFLAEGSAATVLAAIEDGCRAASEATSPQ